VSKKYDKGIDYVNPETNETVKAGGPGNPYGEKFIEMRRGTGIHGINDGEKIGKLVSTGAVVMSNQDIDEVYALVQSKTPVVVKGSVDPEAKPGT
jgi:lipoprotein-anchoring transpeptidase ErfK/SrfK